MAPGAFERAHSSPRADADAGPAGGTAPDSPRAFLAAMEDGVYGRPGEADGRSGSQAQPRTGERLRGAFLRAEPASGPAKSRGFRGFVWAEPSSGGGGRGGAARAGRGGAYTSASRGLAFLLRFFTTFLLSRTRGLAALVCLPCAPKIQTTEPGARASVPFQERHPGSRTPTPTMMEPGIRPPYKKCTQGPCQGLHRGGARNQSLGVFPRNASRVQDPRTSAMMVGPAPFREIHPGSRAPDPLR